MKKALLTMVAVMVSQVAMASNFYCGANVETKPGSQVYDKLAFYDKVEGTKTIQRYVLADGTVLRAEEMIPADLAKLVNGTLVLGVTFEDGKTNIYSARVRITKNEIKHENLAMAGTFDGISPLLIANGASLLCKEM